MPGNKAIFTDAIKKGHNAAWDGQWKKAAEEYRRALAEFPGDDSVRASLAQALEELGQWENALHEYQSFAQAQPRDPMPVVHIAGLQEKLRRPSQAASTYLAAAELFLNANLTAKAIEVWKKAAELEPERTDVYQRLAEIYSRDKQRNLAAKAYLSLAKLYYKRGDKMRARSAVEQALVKDPRNQVARTLLEEVGREGAASTRVASPVELAQKESLARLAQTVFAGPSATRPTGEHRQNDTRPQIEQSEIDSLIARAVGAQAERRNSEALEAYRQLMAAGVVRPEIRFNLGLLYSETMQYDEAIPLLKESVADKNYELASHYALGKCYRAQGKMDDAVDHFMQVVKIVDLGSVNRDQADDLIAGYEGLAESYAVKGDRAQAESFSRAVEDFLSSKGWQDKLAEVRQHLESLRLGDNPVTLAEVIEVPQSDKVLEALALSQEYMRIDKLGAASEECYRAIELAPNYLPAHIYLAEIMAKQNRVKDASAKYHVLGELCVIRGNVKRAENMYRGMVKISADDANTRAKLIDLLLQQNRVDDALGEYLDFGDMYARTGQFAKAMEKLNEGMRLAVRSTSPGSFKTILQHRVAEMQTKQGDLNGALTAYQDIRRQSPDDERAHFHIVDLEFRLGQSSAALSYLDDLVSRYQVRGEPQKATTILEILSRSYPKDAELVMRLAQSYQAGGALEKAVKVLDALGEAQLSAGQTQAAIVTIRRIVELNPPRVEDYKNLLKQLGE